MKAYFINVKEKTITETEVDGLESWYEKIECELVESHKLNKYGDRIIVDEEGTFRREKLSFSYQGARFIGNALIIGCNDEGEETPPVIPIGQVVDSVLFL